jgi:hypothetical protein
VGVLSVSDCEKALLEGKGALPVRACLQHHLFLVAASTDLLEVEVRTSVGFLRGLVFGRAREKSGQPDTDESSGGVAANGRAADAETETTPGDVQADVVSPGPRRGCWWRRR